MATHHWTKLTKAAKDLARESSSKCVKKKAGATLAKHKGAITSLPGVVD